MTLTLGIDLGTTYSSAAYVNRLGKPEILDNRDGERLTPSVVMFQDGAPDQPLVGTMAKNSAAIAPDNIVDYVKRHMGDPDWRYYGPDDREYTAEDISAIILRRLVEDAQHQLGLDEPIKDVVITVPAYFDDARRKATQDAGEIAGLRVRHLLNEPTAAALAYGLDQEEDQTLLVYDLGGGTFDVTLMSIASNEFVVRGTDGDRNLGGFDWDNRLMSWLNDKFVESGGSSLLDSGPKEAGLRQRTESAKRSLTSSDVANVVLSDGAHIHTERVTRVTFDEMTHDLLDRTTDLVKNVLADAGMEWSDLNRILLVGGSTRMPQVREWIEHESKLTPEYGINPDELVALGAAVRASLLDSPGTESGDTASDKSDLATDYRVPVVIRDVTSQSLGTFALDDSNTQMNVVIVERNSEIPASNRRRFATSVARQEAVNVEVTEGDSTDVAEVSVLGEANISLPGTWDKGAPIDIEFNYDIDQTVFVRVFDPQDSDRLLGSFSVDRQANLDETEIALKAQHMQDLRIG